MTLQLSDPQIRYQGLYYDGWMQELADQVAVDMAAHVRAPRRDYQNMDISLAPFYAYELRALNYTRELGEAFERSCLAYAKELNRLAGTEEGWFVLCRSLGSGAALRYVSDSTKPNYLGVDDRGNAIPGAVRKTGVELDIIPPLNLAANATLLAHLANVARIQTVPYTLELVAVNVINRLAIYEYDYVAIYPYVGRNLYGEEVNVILERFNVDEYDYVAIYPYVGHRLHGEEGA